ncbi:hypothetical protein SAMN04488109_5009 [Chryseolinea serpens]|uniref:LexA-binding, inner membrane-associated hydrolase n=1 Tax=Chryseolinea serpens TaxID=947013 RepID=A0A1M5VCZ5_9BACT|nr:hypothetical protein [Chryseolinea serpens]SHH73028.1 hypothetical protein SAMN04488109_5009 [Chryseolinea serpens]
MYAINHAATSLLLKKDRQAVPILPLLISTQVVELFWVVFNYLGIEHFSVSNGKLHLDFLPYSHSIFSSVLLSLISYGIIRWIIRNKPLALPFALGVLSHVALDILFHEKDIQLSPFSQTPVWGLGIISFPFLNFVLEFLYGIFCWWYFKGNTRLLAAILIFNVLDLPVMLASGESLDIFIVHPALLPTFILLQILISWYLVAKFSRT